jgi:hypothetical protein
MKAPTSDKTAKLLKKVWPGQGLNRSPESQLSRFTMLSA